MPPKDQVEGHKPRRHQQGGQQLHYGRQGGQGQGHQQTHTHGDDEVNAERPSRLSQKPFAKNRINDIGVDLHPGIDRLHRGGAQVEEPRSRGPHQHDRPLHHPLQIASQDIAGRDVRKTPLWPLIGDNHLALGIKGYGAEAFNAQGLNRLLAINHTGAQGQCIHQQILAQGLQCQRGVKAVLMKGHQGRPPHHPVDIRDQAEESATRRRLGQSGQVGIVAGHGNHGGLGQELLVGQGQRFRQGPGVILLLMIEGIAQDHGLAGEGVGKALVAIKEPLEEGKLSGEMGTPLALPLQPGRHLNGRVRLRLGEHNIEGNDRGPGSGEVVDHVRNFGPRPGEAPVFAQGTLIDIDNHHRRHGVLVGKETVGLEQAEVKGEHLDALGQIPQQLMIAKLNPEHADQESNANEDRNKPAS